MPDSLSINDLDLWRTETTPAWRVFLPLGIVMLSLVALVVVPPLFTNYATSLRQELSEVLNPLTSAVGALERTTGNELAAARGYAAELSRDPGGTFKLSVNSVPLCSNLRRKKI